ncbi:hypothetical protein [Xenorhabdus szentirmaii]|uniref:Uncharacterized protein n=1 Tax=Xenorhabdus szentirmaii DSM 16338 TaxID=1427518 RepID=W1IRX3_9GAMM|nr:hypothetical protein [Xenorhabdus szentirmaii]PHM30800.1 hypothetical protein Xsze_03914 [Xenorhabdus szentirmaii DSM 16338]PHM40456.1 hypothetical protein Xszus_00115 [Xenorhabdus szentirmaii]CDL81237.1 hypothetical protein XSR1_110112 [Xenorhabdus szentirmaii DSM 16338]
MFGDDISLSYLLTSFTLDECIKNTFISAITWVYFHELGHLSQEHGIYRFKQDELNIISEVKDTNNDELTQEESIIYHATELAADYYSTVTCVCELVRQFSKSEWKVAISFLMTGLPIVLFHFHGTAFEKEQEEPKGSHPYPLTRLELMAPLTYEFLSIVNTDERVEYVNLCGYSVFSVSLFWLRKVHFEPEYVSHYILHGISNRKDILNYLKFIIPAWDSVEPSIRGMYHYGSDIHLLKFSDHLRGSVLNSSPI